MSAELDHWKGVAAERLAEIRKHKRELKDLEARTWREASAATLGSVYAALDDLGLDGAVWLADRMVKSRNRKPPFGFNPDVEKIVRGEIIELLRQMKMSPKRIAAAEAELSL